MREERLIASPAALSARKYTRLLALVPGFRVTLALAVFWGVLETTLTILHMAVLSAIICAIFLQHASLAQIGDLLCWLLLILSGHAVVLWGREVCIREGTLRAQVSLRQRVFAHLLSLGPSWTQRERSGELVTVLGEGIERLDAYLSRYLPQTLLSVLVPFLLLLVIFPRDSVSALLLLCTAPVIPLLMMLIGKRAEQQSQLQWKELAHMSAHFLDVVQGLTTLKLFGRSQAEQERVESISEAFRARTMDTLRLAFLSGAVLEFLTTMAIGLVAVMLGVRLINHQIVLHDALFILLLAPEFYRPLRDLGAARHAGLEGRASAQRLCEILAQLPSSREAPDQLCLPAGPLEIVLDAITYTYPGSKQPVLCDLALTLPAGTCTALVGCSGAGKSTLARLLLRWLQADQGEIAVNGVCLDRLSREDWHTHLAFVPQRPYLFYGTVRENILLARPHASEQALRRAAEMAGALDFIQRLPRGFETQVGEQGACLSAGQVQRIALARAFLKDAPLLILDEPTSNLDPESEHAIRRALAQLVRGRTVLLIAHRLSTIAAASRVLVLEQGRITEAGSPEEWLLRMGCQKDNAEKTNTQNSNYTEIHKDCGRMLVAEPGRDEEAGDNGGLKEERGKEGEQESEGELGRGGASDEEASARGGGQAEGKASALRMRKSRASPRLFRLRQNVRQFFRQNQNKRKILSAFATTDAAGTVEPRLDSAAFVEPKPRRRLVPPSTRMPLRRLVPRCTGQLCHRLVPAEIQAAFATENSLRPVLSLMSQLRLRPAPIGANVYSGGDNASSLRVNGREQRQKAALLTERQTNSRGETRVFWRLLTMQARLAGPALLAALLGCVLVASNLGLLSVAVYLIAASAVVSLLALLTIPIFFVRLMGLVRPLARYGERCVSHDLTFRLLARLRSRIYASLEPLAPVLLLNYRSGDLLTRLLADIDELQHLYLRLLAPLLIACGISLCTFLVLAHFSSLLAWVALAFLLLAAGIVPVLCWRMARGLGTRRLALRAEQKAMFLDGIQGIQDLLACGQALTYLEKLDALDARVSTIQRCLNWIAASQEGLTDFLKQGAVWSLLVLAIPMVAHGRLDGIYPGCLALLVLASFEIAPPLAQVSQFLDHALAAGRRLFALLDAVPVVNEPAQPLPLSQQAISAGCELAFEHLEFSYSRNTGRQECGGVRASEIACSSEGRTEMEWSDAHQSRQQVRERRQLRLDDVDWREVGESGEPVLKDINLRVRAGSRIALVGSSGAGKSTLLRLALRCWDADAGRITLNGLDIRRYALSDVRNLMGVVTQDTHLFHTTLRNNLLIARPQANDDELLRALDLAQLGECVRQLPQGLETRIGEQGTRLSGGERQRLAIARALLKDAPVLLLDEVTANLDLQTEQDVLTALRTLMRGRTVLLVTHRLVGMEHMDEIVVLEHGRIQERGTHAHLLARQGRYAQLWNIQQSVFPVVVASVLDRSGESPGSGTPEVGHPLFSAEEDNEDDGHTMTSTFLHADRRAAVEGSLATAFSGRQPPSEENT